MVAFGHTAIGTITGLVAIHLTDTYHLNLPTGLILAGTLGVISHYVADFIPHGHFFKHRDYGKKVKYAIIFDLLLSILLFTSLSYLKFGLSAETFYILFGIGGAQLPDIIDGLYYTKRLKLNPLLQLEVNFHQATHWHGKLDKSLMISKLDIWQFLTVILAVIAILYQ